MVLILTFLISLLLTNASGDEPKDRSLFISPVKIPLSLSANFGELRADHFHSGIDVRTQGVIGKEVIAAASGYVYRISVSPGGFGKAIYLRHTSGYSTVYGHLDRFTPEIEKYVIARQYEEKRYMVTLWPPKDKFRYEQGEIIAYSGNSGSSSGPHLHYEIRKSDDEDPVNPLLFEFGIEDKIKPVFENLVIYPAGKKTMINNRNKQLKLNVSGSAGNYFLSSNNQLSINGPAGFGFKAYDLLNGSYNKCSVYSIELKIDDIPVFNYKMDTFSFNESRYVNSHIDYETLQREKTYIERAYILPNDKLNAYGNVLNNGIFNFTSERKHNIELIVSDIHNNRSVLTFNVNGGKAVVSEDQTKPDGSSVVMMPYNRNNKFVSKNLTVNIPSGALYDTLYFEFKRSAGNPLMFSDIYQIHNKFTPLHKACNISIKPDRIPEGKQSKMLIIQLVDEIQRLPLNSTWNNGFLTASTNSFGAFFVGIDTVPPLISQIGFSSGASLSGKSNLKIKITDELSGINAYEPQIDGEWALFEYDQKNNMLIYNFDPERIRKGSKHNLILKVSDNKENISNYKCEFTW